MTDDTQESNKPAPTVIVKKTGGGTAGHHGGSWKVAYADFVTALMALFLLLWLLSSIPKHKLTAIAHYFAPTVGISGEEGIGFKGGQTVDKTGTQVSKVSSAHNIVFGAATNGPVIQDPTKHQNTMDEESNFLSLKNSLNKLIGSDPELKKYSKQILVDMTPEGLAIELVDSKKHPMFKPNTDIMMPYTKMILQKIIPIIRYMPNYIMISGHTAPPYKDGENFDLWKLSSERADVTRQFLTGNGIDPAQIGMLTGFADREPLDAQNPYAPENVRIGLIMLKQSIMHYNQPVIFKQNGSSQNSNSSSG